VQARSVLIQVYSSLVHQEWIQSVAEAVAAAIPSALLVGLTTVGEVIEGQPLTGSVVMSLSFFDSSRLTPLAIECELGSEEQSGLELGQAIQASGTDLVGVLLLGTPLSMNATALLLGLSRGAGDVPFFGGGAGDNEAWGNALVFLGTRLISRGAVAVVFSGQDLHIESRSYLGWQALSTELTITQAEGNRVMTVNNAPAFEVYRRYLDIDNDEHFFRNALEFPFLLERNGETLARVPVSVDADGALEFLGDLMVGETFRVGYGNPALIGARAQAMQDVMFDFEAQGLWLFSCSCRRFLMQYDVELETLPFESIAPTVGFYTYGEFWGRQQSLWLLNAAMVVVGLREGGARMPLRPSPDLTAGPDNFDPFPNQHPRVVSRLMHFIGAVTDELEQANRELTVLSITDKLTQVFNRVKLDSVLTSELRRAERYRSQLGVVMLDIDHFKAVNDEFGHGVGDKVLVQMAQIMRSNIRISDVLGRWGGEEFLLILPEAGPQQAMIVAEKIRSIVAATEFPVVQHKTVSLGVTCYRPGDSEAQMMARADEALYEAKNSGRDRIVFR